MQSGTFTRRLLSVPPLVLLALLTIIIIAAGCSAKANDNKEAAAAPSIVKAIPVDGLVVQPASLKEDLEITGSIVANQQVDIASELTRKIVRVNVKEGSNVKQGQLLFELDNADLLAQLDRLKQQEKLAILNEERLNDLIKHEAVVQQDYDQAFTNLKVLQAQINEIKVSVSKTRITAPFSGQIGIVHVYPGAIVSGNTILASLQDNSVVKIDFSIPEKYSSVITENSEQTFTVASDNNEYKAKVIARESRLDQNTRTLLIRAVSSNTKRNLLPGQSARLHLTLHSSNNALLVSSQALLPSSQGYNVYTVRNNHVQLTAVELGQRGPSSVEILKGLNKGDTVVTSNVLRLIPGTEIQFVSVK